MAKYFFSLGLELIALVIGFFSYARLHKVYRVLVVQVLLACMVELAGFLINLKRSPNIWLYNCYMVIDCGLLLWTAWMYVPLRRLRNRLLVCYGVFISCWTMEIILGGWYTLALKALIIHCIIQVLLYIWILYRQANTYEGRLILSPAFWVSTAVVLFYGCCIPLFSLHHYFARHIDEFEKIRFIVYAASCIRYTIYSYVFLLCYRQAGQPIILKEC